MNPKHLFPVALSIVLLAACAPKQTDNNGEAKAEAKQVETTSPRTDTIEIVDTYTANVEAFVKNNIAPQTPNRIERILVEVGQVVSRGQTLAILDQATLKQQELRMRNVEADYRRIEELYKIGGISKTQYESQKMNYEVAETAYRNLKENTLLRSPISGVVTQRNYDSGDMYGGVTPLLVVEQIAPLKLIINASEKYFARVRKGMSVDITLSVFPDEHFSGQVALVHPTIDPATRTFKVEVHLKNQDRRVRPGMYATVNMTIGTEEALLVPDVAILTLPGTNRKYVYVVEEGKAVQRVVKIGQIVGSEIIVTEGLATSDRVVTTGLSLLRNGDVVTE